MRWLVGNSEHRQGKLHEKSAAYHGPEGSGFINSLRDLARVRPQMLLCFAVFSLFRWSAAPLHAQSKPPSEYEDKPAFLNVARFVEWPPALLGEAGPFTFCVSGQDPFGHVIDETMKGRVVENRRILWVRARRPQDLPTCLILFISAPESSPVAELPTSVGNRSVLTVGETRGFAAAGRTIELPVESNQVRSAINIDPADCAGLKISSELLMSARIVHDSAGSADGRD